LIFLSVFTGICPVNLATGGVVLNIGPRIDFWNGPMTRLLPPSDLSRRRFLQTLAGGAMTCVASPVLANFVEQRSLQFVHTHTAEKLTAVYFRDGLYDQSVLARVAYTLRDFRSGDVYGIDPMLLDALFELQVRSGHDKPYQIISAYRSPKTNKNLSAHNKGVAEHSMHMKGKAIDIRVSGVNTKKLRDHALAMMRGGVGYYHDSNFLHVDTGRVRSW
jgi:uncharacterized protein YcbK (DUF882 family)